MSDIGKRLQITYNCGVTQIFTVISHDDFLNILKPLERAKDEIEALSKKGIKKRKVELDEINEKLKAFDFKWCTDKSPIYKSVFTQVLSLGPNQGGDSPVVAKLID